MNDTKRNSLIIPPAANEEVEAQPATVNCTACRFFRLTNALAPKQGGACRYNPPQTAVVGVQRSALGEVPIAMSFWPSVGKTDWCSKFEFVGEGLRWPPAKSGSIGKAPE